MPIALFVAPRVEEMLRARFGDDNFWSLKENTKSRENSDSLDPENSKVLVQLDQLPHANYKGCLPGLHWLEDQVAQDKLPSSSSIILTAWDQEIFESDSAVSLQERLGVQPRSNLLASPLVKFVSLADLFTPNRSAGLDDLFPHLNTGQIYSSARLLEDIKLNCYALLGVSSRLHRIRYMFIDFWQKRDSIRRGRAYEHIRLELEEIYKVVLPKISEAEEHERVENRIRAEVERMQRANNLVDFTHSFNDLETLLIDLDQRSESPFEPLSSHIILISRDRVFYEQLKKQLKSGWQVDCTVVDNVHEAIELLDADPYRYSCVLTNFRNTAPNGKMMFWQGYENLYVLQNHHQHNWLRYAFLTGMRNARWEQPGHRSWWAFEKQALEELEGKEAQAFYFFLQQAEQRRFHRVSVPPKELVADVSKNSLRMMEKPGMGYLAYIHLNKKLPEGRSILRSFSQGNILHLDWDLTTRYQPDNEVYMLERLFYRLIILAALRQSEILDDNDDDYPQTHASRRNAVLSRLIRNGHKKVYDCKDYLRIESKLPYNQLSLDELLKQEKIFYHEYVLLPKLIIEPNNTTTYGD